MKNFSPVGLGVQKLSNVQFLGFGAPNAYELQSKLLEWGDIGGYIVEYYRGSQGGYLEFSLWLT